MPRLILAAVCAALVASPALADFEERRSTDDVETVMDRLEAAVDAAGATIFARVNHATGAETIGMDLPQAQLLIFGNPMIGTPAMQDDIRAGLLLPLRVLVHADGEESVIVWEDPAEMFDDLDISEDAEYLGRMRGALENLTGAAAGE